MISHPKGIIKYHYQDFIVIEKIIPQFNKGSNFSLFLLSKQNTSMFNCLMRISKILKIPIAKINFFGEKDKYAQTKQIIYTPKLNIIPSEISSNGFELLYLFDTHNISPEIMIGNYFKITARKIKELDIVNQRIQKIISRQIKIPNYYDIQRFGKRYINHVIGYYLLNNKYFEATYLLLCSSSKNENRKVKKARQKLRDLFEGQNFNIDQALELKLPQYMDLEKIFLKILSKKRNYKKAWKEFPHKFSSLFKQAYFSYKFNTELSKLIKNTTDNYIVKQYEITIPQEVIQNFLTNFNPTLELIYPEEEINIQHQIQDYQKRNLFILPDIKHYNFEKDEIFEGYYKLTIEFFLTRGGFATNILNYILG
ncbi:MAG: tRNA pseudouridine(13) synthase TruD [bacterium]